MAKFNTKHLAPKGTARYELPEVAVDGQEGVPTLIVRHSSAAWRAMKLRAASAQLAGSLAAPIATDPTAGPAEALVAGWETRTRDTLDIAPGVLVVGWEHFHVENDDGSPIVDADGKLKPAEFDADLCAQLLAILPEPRRDLLALFLDNRSNFPGEPPEVVAKNS